MRLLVENHDLIVRHRWENTNDLAIWDNRSVRLHCSSETWPDLDTDLSLSHTDFPCCYLGL